MKEYTKLDVDIQEYLSIIDEKNKCSRYAYDELGGVDEDACLTENGGLAFSTTKSKLVDFFSLCGSMRESSVVDIANFYIEARKENQEYADRVILYCLDIRGFGVGERRISKILLYILAKLDPEKVIRNLKQFVDLNRWDILYCLEHTPAEEAMWKFLYDQLLKDMENMKKGKPISLCAKWLKSPNTSSKYSVHLARKFCSKMNISEQNYRKMLSALRRYSNVVEVKMSANEWKDIDFEKVPSIALNRYKKCFSEHCDFESYIRDVQEGKKKINASVISPVEICQDILNDDVSSEVEGALLNETQWQNLPDYVGDENILVMADVSGSMTWPNQLPISASIGMAIYFAERNNGAYKNQYMTFSGSPHFITINPESSLIEKINQVMKTDIGYNTNMDKAFRAVFNMALKTRETPKAMLVISDGEMDHWVRDRKSDSIVSKWNNKLVENGLEPIKVISWNVSGSAHSFLGPMTDNISYMSGYSINSFKQMKEFIECSAYDAMIKILDHYSFN